MHAISKLLAALCACATLALTLVFGAPASAAPNEVPIKFILDWKIQGPHAWFLLARDKGYFKQEGVDITIDAGDGSAAAVTRIATGAYDAGFGDINALVAHLHEVANGYK